MGNLCSSGIERHSSHDKKADDKTIYEKPAGKTDENVLFEQPAEDGEKAKNAEDKKEEEKDTLTGGFAAGANLLSSATDQAKCLAEGAGNETNNLVSEVKQAGTNIQESAQEKVSETADNVQKTSETLTSEVETKANKTAEEVKAAGEDAKAAAAGKLEELKTEVEKKAEEVKTGLESKVEAVKTGVENKVEEVKQEAENKMENIKTEMENKVEEVTKDAERKVEEAKTMLATKADEMKTSLGNKMEAATSAAEIKTDIENKVDGTILSGTQAATDAAEATDVAMSKAKASIETQKQDLEEERKEVAQQGETMLSNVEKTVTDTMLENADTGIVAASEIKQSAVDKVTQVQGSCKDTVQTVEDNVAETLQAGAEGMTETIRDAKEEAETKVQSMEAKAAGIASSTEQTVAGKVNDLLTSANSETKGSIQVPQQEASSFLEGVTSGVDNLVQTDQVSSPNVAEKTEDEKDGLIDTIKEKITNELGQVKQHVSNVMSEQVGQFLGSGEQSVTKENDAGVAPTNTSESETQVERGEIVLPVVTSNKILRSSDASPESSASLSESPSMMPGTLPGFLPPPPPEELPGGLESSVDAMPEPLSPPAAPEPDDETVQRIAAQVTADAVEEAMRIVAGDSNDKGDNPALPTSPAISSDSEATEGISEDDLSTPDTTPLPSSTSELLPAAAPALAAETDSPVDQSQPLPAGAVEENLISFSEQTATAVDQTKSTENSHVPPSDLLSEEFPNSESSTVPQNSTLLPINSNEPTTNNENGIPEASSQPCSTKGGETTPAVQLNGEGGPGESVPVPSSSDSTRCEDCSSQSQPPAMLDVHREAVI